MHTRVRAHACMMAPVLVGTGDLPMRTAAGRRHDDIRDHCFASSSLIRLVLLLHFRKLPLRATEGSSHPEGRVRPFGASALMRSSGTRMLLRIDKLERQKCVICRHSPSWRTARGSFASSDAARFLSLSLSLSLSHEDTIIARIK